MQFFVGFLVDCISIENLKIGMQVKIDFSNCYFCDQPIRNVVNRSSARLL